MPLKCLLLAGTGLLGSGVWVQGTQKGPTGRISMNNESRAAQVMQARAAYTARHEAFRRTAPPGRNTSPQAIEATLASISEEVTAEASERRRDEGKPR